MPAGGNWLNTSLTNRNHLSLFLNPSSAVTPRVNFTVSPIQRTQEKAHACFHALVSKNTIVYIMSFSVRKLNCWTMETNLFLAFIFTTELWYWNKPWSYDRNTYFIGSNWVGIPNGKEASMFYTVAWKTAIVQHVGWINMVRRKIARVCSDRWAVKTVNLR